VKVPDITSEDMETINQPIDFLGVNNYFSSVIKFDGGNWPIQATGVDTGKDKTDMGWEINAEGIYDLLMYLHKNIKESRY